MTSAQKLIEYLKKNGKDKSWPALTKQFNPKTSNIIWSRDTARINGFDTRTNRFTVAGIVENTKQQKEVQQHRNESNQLVKKIIELEKDLKLLEAVKEYEPKRFVIPAPVNKGKKEATAIIQWSDWHVDEKVESETVNSMNEYNQHVAKKRAFKLFENSVKLTNTQRSAVSVKRLILHLGGDSIGAFIHPELVQTNTMSPLEGIFFAKELHINGIDYLLQYGEFDEIIVVCSRGNHPRLTPKMQYANDYSMNLETFLYLSLMDHYRNNRRVVFKVEKSELSYVTVYGKVLRFFHGWQIKSQGGIGGIGIPLYKKIHRWNTNKPAYYNFMCDKHTYSQPTPDCQLNGSMKGFDAFAESNGFPYQAPIQSFTLMDSEYGITIKAPIFCE
jgi:hypothetical protein